MAKVFIGIGANQGNKEENIRLAFQLLPPAVKICRRSLFYLTEPWGYKEQDPFINAVWEGETSLSPEDLLVCLKRIEQNIGRKKTVRYGPRAIDLDILLYDDIVYSSDTLTIPHMQITGRRFVLQPLSDLAPDMHIPGTTDTVKEFLSQCPDDYVEPLREEIDLAAPVIRWGLRPYLMGIINLTPDSFSGDGITGPENEIINSAMAKTAAFLRTGADIIDIGAESTRPSADSIPAVIEQQRLLPALKAIREVNPHVVISVDTYKVETAEKALECGANWINDVSGGADPAMFKLAVSSACPIVLMRNHTINHGKGMFSPDKVIEFARRELIETVGKALKAGVKKQQIILDPGLGFGTTAYDNLTLLNRLNEIKEFGYPLLVGPSRKSFIGAVLQKPEDERLAGTAAAVYCALTNGADVIRAHDVEFMYDLIKLFDAVRHA